MIVVRWTVGNQSQEVRSSKARIVLGSGSQADLRLRDAGWGSREAVLQHGGTEVILTRPGKKGSVTVRVGDVVHLGGARITLVGLLPRTTVSKPAAAPPPVSIFGGYDEAVPQGFALEPEAPPSPTTSTTPVTPAAPAPRKLREPGHFGDDLVAALKKAPFFGVSVALHALVFLAVLFLRVSPADAPTQTVGEWSIDASIAAPAEVEGPPAPPDVPKALPEMEEVLPEADEDETPDPADFTPVPTSTVAKPDLAELESDQDSPPLLGAQPSLSASRARTKPSRPKALEKDDVHEVFEKATAGSANEKAAGLVRAQVGLGEGGRGAALQNLARADILVVDGSFDHMGQVLDSLRLPYLLVTPYAVAQPNAPSLTRHKLVFWNCGEGLPPRDRKVVAKRLKSFVEGGGYLFTTDWCVENLLEPAFPGFLTSNGRHAPLPETVIDVQPSFERRDHPLLDGVFLPGVKGKWWLEQASFDVDVVKPDAVEVLIESPTLRDLYHRGGAVAVTFHAGRGRVLHIMGHYYQEAGNLAGTMAAQRLALNFVLLRLAQGD